MNKLKLFFIISLTTTSILLLVSQNVSPKKLPEKISQKQIGKTYSIAGEIEKITSNTNQISILLKNNSINIVLFPGINSGINLQKDQKISVIGKLDFYKNNPEIITDKIIILSN